MQALRVVVADDESIIRLDLKETLRKMGHEVVGEAGDGKTALDLARKLKPDVVMMDIKMPEMDGIDAAKVISQEKVAPVVLVTAKSTDNDVFWGKKQGAVEHVAKPWTPGIIEMILQKYCPR